MLVSVGGDYVAGLSYRVPKQEADALILKGYAEGELSRPYSDEEVSSLRSTQQVVML